MSKFCHNCGAQLEEGAPFCNMCGEKQEVEAALVVEAAPEIATETAVTQTATAAAPEVVPQEAPATPVAEASPSAPPAPKKKLQIPLGLKIAVIAILVIAIGLFVASKVLTSLNSPDKISEAFIAALDAGDSEQLLALTTSGNRRVTLDVTTIAPFMALYLSDKDFAEDLVDKLDDDIKNLNKDRSAEEDGLVYMEAEEGLLFTSYTVVIPTVETYVYTNVLSATYTINGEELDVVSSLPSDVSTSSSASTTTDSSTASSSSSSSTDDTAYNAYSFYVSKDRYYDYGSSGYVLIEDVFPGLYTIEAVAPNGITLSQDITASLDEYNASRIAFSYFSLYIYNDFSTDMVVYADNKEITTIAPYESYTCEGIDASTNLSLSLDFGIGDPVTLAYSYTDNTFATSDTRYYIELDNYAHYDFDVMVNGVTYDQLADYGYTVVSMLSSNDVVELVPTTADCFEPITIDWSSEYYFSIRSTDMVMKDEDQIQPLLVSYIEEIYIPTFILESDVISDNEPSIEEMMEDILVEEFTSEEATPEEITSEEEETETATTTVTVEEVYYFDYSLSSFNTSTGVYEFYIFIEFSYAVQQPNGTTVEAYDYYDSYIELTYSNGTWALNS